MTDRPSYALGVEDSLDVRINPATEEKQDTIISNQTGGAQIVQARLYDGSGNAISSLSGAIDVHNADVHTSIFSQSFLQDTATTTTISTTQAAGDTQITVVDGSGFAVGEYLTIAEGTNNMDDHYKVIAKPSTHVITLDSPIDFALTSAAVVTQVLQDMNLSGSLASPQSFRVAPPSDETWDIIRLLFSMTDETVMDDSKFGGATALTNGVVIRYSNNGVLRTIAKWKDNSQIADSMYDVTYSDKAPAGSYGLRGRWTFTNAGGIIKLAGATSDYLEILVQDNLTVLTDFHATAQGHKESF